MNACQLIYMNNFFTKKKVNLQLEINKCLDDYLMRR